MGAEVLKACLSESAISAEAVWRRQARTIPGAAAGGSQPGGGQLRLNPPTSERSETSMPSGVGLSEHFEEPPWQRLYWIEPAQKYQPSPRVNSRSPHSPCSRTACRVESVRA